MEHHRAAVNGIDLHYVESGRGPLVVLLHGFPEYWYSWRKQIPALAGAGFRVVAVDLRGYNESSKPSLVSDYRIVTVANDVAALIREKLNEPAVLVGHDWGGLAAWLLAMMHPELLRKLVVLNMPHPVPLVREIHRSTRQKLRLAYQLFFRVPMIPELLMPMFLPTVLRRAGRFTPEEIAEYKKVWRGFDTRRGMAHYYRAGLRYRGEVRQYIAPIALPTLLIWGERDPVFTRETTENFEQSVPNLRIARIPGAGHFVQTDAPETVNELLVEFAR